MEEPTVSDSLVREIETRWAEARQPVRLTELGKTEPAVRAKQLAGSLAKYLANYLADRATVLRHSTIGPLVAVVPKGKEPPPQEVDQALAKLPTKGDAGRSTIMPRYRPELWKAFRSPVPEGDRRIVVSLDPLEISDLPTDSQHRGLEISPEYIAPTALPASIHESIVNWAAANKIPLSKLILSDQRHYSTTLLDRLLEAIGSDDLRRISMPLDIVQRLRRARI